MCGGMCFSINFTRQLICSINEPKLASVCISLVCFKIGVAGFVRYCFLLGHCWFFCFVNFTVLHWTKILRSIKLVLQQQQKRQQKEMPLWTNIEFPFYREFPLKSISLIHMRSKQTNKQKKTHTKRSHSVETPFSKTLST